MNFNDLTHPTHFSPRTVLRIGILAALVVLITFIYSAWQWRNDWILAHQTVAKETVMVKTDSTSDLIAAITGDHIFGKSPSKLGDMPISNLQLHVTGIVKVDSNQSNSVSKAYISIAGQPSKIYQVGDTLPYGVKVNDITPDAVVLENDGHLEKLPLPRAQLKFKAKYIEGEYHD